MNLLIDCEWSDVFASELRPVPMYRETPTSSLLLKVGSSHGHPSINDFRRTIRGHGDDASDGGTRHHGSAGQPTTRAPTIGSVTLPFPLMTATALFKSPQSSSAP